MAGLRGIGFRNSSAINKADPRRSLMEVAEAVVSDAHEEIIVITLTGDEDEWREIAAVLKESDSDLATELGLKIREALRFVGQ